IKYSKERIEKAVLILKKYNTRENYREIEYSSITIFSEIIRLWGSDLAILDQVRSTFYSFFQSDSKPYDDVELVLSKLKKNNFKIAVLTDVAYGMDNKYSLKDIESISNNIDLVLTSVDVGYRKPNPKGYKMILDYFKISPSEMIYIGDEEKDITGANELGIKSALINRNCANKNFEQLYTLNSLNDILNFLEGVD
ncbi:MAG: HAD family hydrolase, partial [Clostridiales bacterium]